MCCYMLVKKWQVPKRAEKGEKTRVMRVGDCCSCSCSCGKLQWVTGGLTKPSEYILIVRKQDKFTGEILKIHAAHRAIINYIGER